MDKFENNNRECDKFCNHRLCQFVNIFLNTHRTILHEIHRLANPESNWSYLSKKSSQ